MDRRVSLDIAKPDPPSKADPHRPINPPVSRGDGAFALPAFVSNGLIGLRVVESPLTTGVAMLNGFVGEHPEKRIEAAARTPYPLGGDVSIDGVLMSHAPHLVGDLRQSYDFAVGELTSCATFRATGATARIEVLTFCSRRRPTLACQEIRLTVDAPCTLSVSAGIDARGVYGREAHLMIDRDAVEEARIDAGLRWESHGGVATCGLAFVTDLLDAEAAERTLNRREQLIETCYRFEARPGRTYRLRQMTSLVAEGSHHQPDLQAARLAAMAASDGFDEIRAENRAEWREIWKGRIRLVGADRRWQELADAAFFYLNASTHHAALASTSIFGLAAWRDYHHYYGHVMWDLETFVVPPLTLLQPHAVASCLNYRFRHLETARANAALFGRRGLQFPWESGPSTGQEAAPPPGSASWHEDHVSLDVARAFAFYADVTGDKRFLRERAAPVLSGVADWIESRVTQTARGLEIRKSMGVAERAEPSDNPAFVTMAAKVVLNDAIRVCRAAGLPFNPQWADIAEQLVLPARGDVIVSHDGYRVNEEKGATPDPLLGVFPLDCELADDQVRATLDFYLAMADDYVGSPMLSALYGVWAARAGDRRRALRLLEEGYGKFVNGRFHQTMEYRPDRFPEQPMAGPFFANIGGFIMSLLLGFPGLAPNDAAPETWPRHKVVLPAGWKAIEVDRLWVRGQPMRLLARQGEMAALTPLSTP